MKNIELESKLKATQETFDSYHKLQMEETAQQTGDLLRRIDGLEMVVGHLQDELGKATHDSRDERILPYKKIEVSVN